MTRTLLVPLMAGLFVAQAAAADDRPPLHPTRDVAVTYKMVGVPSGQMMQMAYSAATGLIRGEAPAMNGYMIIDRSKKRTTMVMPDQKMYVEIDASQNPQMQQQVVPDGATSFARKGTETVAGTSCTLWEITSSHGNATACITADGVPLRTTGSGGHGLEAVKVAYGPIPGTNFQVPAGFQKMDVSGMGAMMGGGQGGGRPPQAR